jgi:hypothetical protein
LKTSRAASDGRPFHFSGRIMNRFVSEFAGNTVAAGEINSTWNQTL